MISYMHMGAGLMVGVLLGSFFYGGLWWTLARSMTLAQPAWLILGSFVLRMLSTLAGFYVAMRAGWPSLITALVAFLITRIVVTRLVGAPERRKNGGIPRGMS